MTVQALRHAASRVLHPDDKTNTWVTMADLGLEHPDRQAYIPSAWWVLRWLLPKADVSSSDVLVEFGCGKGRIVLDAARRYPFREVIGVELSEELAAVARELLAAHPRRRAGKVTVLTMDATSFPVPDDMTFAYMFNPFGGETFERVLANILASLDRSPRRLRLIYVNPVEHDTVMASGRARVIRRVHTTRLVDPVGAGLYDLE